MMNMSPAILNYTVKFNQTVAAVQYNDTNSSFSSLHCVFISRSLRFFTPESPRLLQLRFSSLRCDGFDFRAEVRIRLCFSVILQTHRLKTERETQSIRSKFISELKAAFTLRVLMHRSDLLTISDFLAHLFTFILSTTGIQYLCLH